MIAVLGGLADVERDLIRTAEGLSRAKARGAHLGRPRKMTPDQQREARQRLSDSEPLADLARTDGVSASTISRLRAS